MTARRLNISPRKSPALTGGDDRPTAACERRIDLVDATWKGGAAGNFARPRLLRLCGECPLRQTCWADKKWRDALRGTQ